MRSFTSSWSFFSSVSASICAAISSRPPCAEARPEQAECHHAWPHACRRAEHTEVRMPRSESPTGKREVIAPNGSQRYVRRDASGQFTTDQVQTGRSIARDRQRKAKHTAPKGMKDRGD